MRLHSIRGSLTLGLCALACLLLPLTGSLIYVTVRSQLLTQQEAWLKAKAEALIAAMELDEGKLRLDPDIVDFAGLSGSGIHDTYIITGPDGTSLARSRELLNHSFAPPPSAAIGNTPQFTWSKSPDNRSVRVLWMTASIRDPASQMDGLHLAVATDSESLRDTLSTLSSVLFASAGLGTLVSLATMLSILHFSLRPLGRLEQDVQAIRVGTATQRVTTTGLPHELTGISHKFNELLERVEHSIARERGFSSHAAHELRTPLAELRALSELISTWPDEDTPEQRADLINVVAEMDALLQKLSLLAKCDAGEQEVNREPVSLKESIDIVLQRYDSTVRERNLTISAQIQDQKIETDPTLHHIILTNLVGNAVSHAPKGTSITLVADRHQFSVTNAAPGIQPGDLHHLFERFWKKNGAGPESESHSGLGLSLVVACCQALGGHHHARIDEDENLVIQVIWNGA